MNNTQELEENIRTQNDMIANLRAGITRLQRENAKIYAALELARAFLLELGKVPGTMEYDAVDEAIGGKDAA